MVAETLVRAEDLHRFYGPHHALRGVGFELRRGEVLGLLGPNGAGKTSTLQILCGALAPSAGRVRIAGADLLDDPLQAKRHIGYLPERAPLYADLTVDEYLRHCAALRRVRRRERAHAVAEAKARCALEGLGERLLANLSRGHQQRVGIAQALVHRPDVVVLDEPTVGLDPIQIRAIRALVRELGAEHGVILSTHILPEVQAVCDRVQIIHEGRSVLSADLEELAAGAGERSLRLALRRPPPDEALLALPGVRRVERLDPRRVRVFHDAAPGPVADAAEAMAAAAARGDWGLFELVPESRSLEEVFVALTCGDADPPPAVAPHRPAPA